MNQGNDISASVIREGLESALESDEFRNSPRLKEVLRHIVEKTLDGRSSEINEMTLAVEVFHRKADALDVSDSVVRVSMARLRRKLSHYYQSEGRSDKIRIEIGAGSYTPSFIPNEIRTVEVVETLEQEEETEKPVVPKPSTPVDTLTILGLAALVVINAAFLVYLLWGERGPQPEDPVPFVAVAHLANSTDIAGYGGSFQTALTSDLSKLSGLRVMAPAGPGDEVLKSMSLNDMRDKFGISHLVRGGLSIQGETLRADLQLVETSTSQIIWAERFEGPASQFASFEKRAINRVATALSVVVDPDETQRIYLGHTDSRQAIKLFSQAMSTLYPPEDAGRIYFAIDLFNQVKGIDPDFAGGHAGLSLSHSYLAMYRHTPRPDLELELAMRDAVSAVELDPTFALGHSAKGLVYSLEKKHQQAIIESRRAVVLEPEDPMAQFWLARVLILAGHNLDALAAIDEALRLDPRKVRTPYRNVRGAILNNLMRYSDAVAMFEENVDLGGPQSTPSKVGHALAQYRNGNTRKAQELIAEVNAGKSRFDARYWVKSWIGPTGGAEEAIADLLELGLNPTGSLNSGSAPKGGEQNRGQGVDSRNGKPADNS